MESTTYKPKVFVAILEQGWIRPEMASWIGIMKADPRADVHVAYCHLRPSETNRNNTVKVALEQGFDYLISIDHDNPPTQNPVDLVFLEKDIVAFAVPQWNMADPNFPLYFVAMDKAENGYTEHKQKEGLQEVDAVGSGLICISRKVMETVKEPFVRKWTDGIATTGLDFYFCEKAKAEGFKIYCHYDYLAQHFKEVDLLSVLNFKINGR